jgi:hypothetical protein
LALDGEFAGKRLHITGAAEGKLNDGLGKIVQQAFKGLVGGSHE